MKLRILYGLVKTVTLGIILLFILSMIPSGIASEQVESSPVQSSEEYKIFLKSRQFIPTAGITPSAETKITTSSLERVHVLMQFQHIPDATERKALEEAGVELLAYVHINAWFVSMPSSGVAIEEVTSSSMRWIGEILPEDKLSPYIQENNFGDWAINPDGTVNLIVEFFSDVPLDDAEQIIEGHGGVTNGRIKSINALVITIPPDALTKLANEDGVQWIEQVSPPPIEELAQSRPLVGGDTVQAAPYNLNGSDVQVLVYDSGNVDNTHDDLQGRVTWGEVSASGIRSHSTHVAGIIAGNGSINWNLRGMAPSVEIISYDTAGDLEDEYDEAIRLYGIDIASNSWGTGVEAPNCALMGDYNPTAQLLDAIVGGSLGEVITIVFSGGNERNDNDCGTDPLNWDNNYACVNPPKPAKNIITVGATYSDTDGMTCFSSWGPVDDGRLKPDVVAPGDEANDNPANPCLTGSEINSTLPGDTYGEMAGTSMAAPHVSGSAALMLQDYRNTHSNVDPWPSTIKALLMHTAVDLGKPGPDYQFGYGRIDVQDAVDMIRDDAACCNVIIENNISANGEMDNYSIEVPAGTSELKITLVWTDVPGTPNGGKNLVNDLDLILKDPNDVRKYPWTLDPSHPANDAVRNERDDLNNVEQVYVSNPIQGTWNITVNGTTVPEPIQNYSLVSSFPMKEEVMSDVAWSIEKGLCWLYQNQNPDGSWNGPWGGADVGVTSMAALSFLNQGYTEDAPTVKKAIHYILGNVQDDGSIQNGYGAYHTSLAILSLVATHNSDYHDEITNAKDYLLNIQNVEANTAIDDTNPIYGGWGYDSWSLGSWSDNSNTQFALMALDAAYGELGLSKPSYTTLGTWTANAVKFLQRVQNRPASNDQPWADDEAQPSYNDGGFIYHPNGWSPGASGSESYGSMTAAGVWSMRLCGVPAGDPRVQAGLGWLQSHEDGSFDDNPNAYDGRAYQYYYYLTIAKALVMSFVDEISGIDWYDKLSAKLAELQYQEGYWVNDPHVGHGAEYTPEIATSYSLLALQTKKPPAANLWMSIILASNADLVVYDPQGRHARLGDVTIPGATFEIDADGRQIVNLRQLKAGVYRIELIGTADGGYSLTVEGYRDSEVTSSETFEGTISTGERHETEALITSMVGALTIYVEEPTPPLNLPPVADAGPDQTVERSLSDSKGAEVTLDGSGSYDPDGDPITYEWTWDAELTIGVSPTVVLPMGTTMVILTVSDGELSDTDTVEITVEDTIPPEVSIEVPVANAALQDGVTLTADASDLSGVTEVYFYVREPGEVDGTPIGYEELVLVATFNIATDKWEYQFDTTQLPDGYYVILAKAVDFYGNEGWSDVVPFSIRNWAVVELLPASERNKAGRTMPVKFALRIAESVDPEQPFVYNEELEIRIYNAAHPDTILQSSQYGDTSRDYRIDSDGELYITNFKTKKRPAEYVVEIWRDFLVGSFTFETKK